MITLEIQSHSMGNRFEGKENYRFHTHWKENSRLEVLSTTGNMHVALIGGGMSAERQVSLTSSKVVSDALVATGYRVTFVDMGADIASRLHLLKPDVVYNCLHGTYGEDGCLPGILNTMRIPYTHSGVLASALAFDKLQTRNFFMMNDINMAECMVIKKNDNVENDPMPRPYVIKPLRQGSSIGVEVVFEDDDFSFDNYTFPYGDQVIVEKYIKGRELQVVVLNGKAIGALETKLLHSCFNDYETKYGEDMAEYLCPAPLPLFLYNRLLLDSEKVYNSLNCKGPATLDFILEDESQELFALELNTHPEMTQTSVVLKITESIAGMDIVDVVEAILVTASYDL